MKWNFSVISTMNGMPLSVSGSRVLLGVRTNSTCSEHLPFVFTRVAKYASWIAQNTNVTGVDYF